MPALTVQSEMITVNVMTL